MTASQHGDPTTELEELKRLDPAGAPDPQSSSSRTAQAMLERIITDPGPTSPPRTPATRRRRWTIGAAAAGMAAAGLVVAIVTTSNQPAFATWTAVPEDVPPAQWEEKAAACSSDKDGVVLAEERGRVTLILRTRSDYLQYCFLADDRWIMDADSQVRPSERQVGATEAKAQVASSSSADGEGFSVIVGRVGPDVDEVIVHPAETGDAGGTPRDVTATVDDGYFAAWWLGELGAERPTLTVRLADGTVREQPAFDDGE